MYNGCALHIMACASERFCAPGPAVFATNCSKLLQASSKRSFEAPKLLISFEHQVYALQVLIACSKQLEAATPPTLQHSLADMQTVTAAPAGNEQRTYVLKESLSFKSLEAASGKRNAGRQREEGTVLRVVRAVTGSAVKPLLVSQSSLPAVEHAAPTKPSQPPSKAPKAAAAAAAAAEAENEADIAAAKHTAMLQRYRATWAVTKQDTIWIRLCK
jgi:hypothetical protein